MWVLSAHPAARSPFHVSTCPSVSHQSVCDARAAEAARLVLRVQSWGPAPWSYMAALSLPPLSCLASLEFSLLICKLGTTVGLPRILLSYMSTAQNNSWHLESPRQLLGLIVIRIIVVGYSLSPTWGSLTFIHTFNGASRIQKI